MGDLNVNIGGDPSGALAALAAVQAAIDALSGRTVTVEVNTRATDRAAADLAALDHALTRATSSAGGFAATSDLATSSAVSHAAAVDRAASSARDHAVANELADASVRDLGADVARASSQIDAGSGAMRRLGADTNQAGSSVRALTGSVATAGLSAGVAATSVGELAAGAGHADQFMVDAAGSAQRMSRDLVPLATGARRATIELRDFGDGVFRATGELDRARSPLGGATDMVGRLLGDAGKADNAVEGLASSSGRAGLSLGSMVRPLMMVGLGAGIATIGAGLLTAGVAGLGVAGFAAVGGLGAVKDMVTKTFEQMSHTGVGALRASSAFGDLQHAVKGFASEMQEIGRNEAGPVLRGMQSLTEGATQMVRNLEPAIGPAIQATTDFGNAIMKGLSSPEAVQAITSFAKAVSANSPAIADATTGIVKIMTGVGEAAADAAPLIGWAAQTTGDFIGMANTAGGRWGVLGAALQSTGGQFGALGALLGSPGGLLGAGGLGIGSLLGGGGDIGLGTVTATGRSIGSALVSGASSAVTSTEDAVHTIVRKWTTKVTEAGSMAAAAGSALGGALAGGAGTVLTTAENLIHTIVRRWSTRVQDAGSGAASAGSTVGSAMLGGLMGAAAQSITSTENLVHTIVRRWMTRVQDSGSSTAEAAGSALGGMITGGAATGITSTETRVHTIVRRWITRVIEIAENALDAHSPSRVFIDLGQGIADGLAIGVEGHASYAVDATAQMATQAVSGAKAAVGAVQNQLGAGNLHPALPSALPQNILGSAMAQAREHGRSLEAAAANHIAAARAAEDHRDALKRLDDSQKASGTTSAQNIQRRIEAEQARAAEQQAKQKERHDAAMWRLYHGVGPGSATPEGIKADAAAWQAQQHPKPPPAPQPRPSWSPPALSAGFGSFAADVAKGFIFGSTSIPNLLSQGRGAGHALGQGMGDGIRQSTPNVMQQAVSMASNMTDRVKKWLGIASPSQVFHNIGSDTAAGMAGGLGSAMSSASDGVRGIASDRGLQVGYTWGRSVITGADAVLKKADFQAASFPQIESPQAKAALGALGLLGPAGSGAQIWKTPAVTLAAAPASAPPRINLTVNLDGQPFRQMTAEQIDAALDELASSISRQVG